MVMYIFNPKPKTKPKPKPELYRYRRLDGDTGEWSPEARTTQEWNDYNGYNGYTVLQGEVLTASEAAAEILEGEMLCDPQPIVVVDEISAEPAEPSGSGHARHRAAVDAEERKAQEQAARSTFGSARPRSSPCAEPQPTDPRGYERDSE